MKIFFFKPKNSEKGSRKTLFSPTSKPARVQSRGRTVLKWGFRLFLALLVIGTVSAVALFAWVAKDLPSPGKVNTRVIAESTKIYDRSGGHLLYEVHGEEKRTLVPFDQIPQSVQKATISLEDQDFYAHHGIKFSSILRAVFKDIVQLSASQGGSTITQQFVKNSLLTNEKTLLRKIKEVILSIEIEQKFSKDEILAMYLNEIPYGSNAYGIEAAAQTFFGKSARDLALDEAALLAALPQAPSYYSPYGSHIDALVGRKQFAINQMAKLGYITEDEARSAIETNTIGKLQPKKDIIAAPHFVMYILEYLGERYGNEVETMGLKVYTTLDWEKQMEAEKIVRDQAVKNEEDWNAENAALAAIDPKTGQILVMVGSRDYFDKEIDGNVNVTIRDRQPGSSFKPYVYLTAFARGYTPESMIYDVETNFETAEGKDYTPLNYDGKFRGPIHMKEALAQSLNIPAVKTLYLVGVKDAIDMAKSLGITGLTDESRYGLSLVLGGGEVRLIDHVHGYATLAAGGVRREMTPILRVEDAKGTILEQFKDDPGVRVVDEQYVAMLDHIMSTNDYRAPVFGSNSPLRFNDRPVAAKTGTTNEFRDGWTLGYTPSLAVGVWAGNNDNSPLRTGADGVNVAAPIFRSFMAYAIQNTAVEPFPEYKPDEWFNKDEEWMKKPMINGELEAKKDVRVCEIPGKDDEYCLANDYCPEDEREKKSFASTHSILHYVDLNDPRGPIPEKPDRDPQYKNWENAIRDWYREEEKKVIRDEPPTEECREDDFKKYRPSISLSVPGNAGASFTIKAEADAPYGVDKLRIYVDGDEISSTSSSSLTTTYDVPAGKIGSTLSVKAWVRDENGNEDETSESVSTSL